MHQLYTLYFNKDEKPDIGKEIYSYSREMKRNDITWTWQDGYRVFIKATEYSETGKIWIGLKPLLGNYIILVKAILLIYLESVMLTLKESIFNQLNE